MDGRLLLVEFSGELDAAEPPLERQEPLLEVKQVVLLSEEALIFQAEALFGQQEAPVDGPELGILGVESVESAGIFSKLYTRVRERIMRARAREEKWV